MKNSWMRQASELKIGEVGCITFSVLRRAKNRATRKTTLPAEAQAGSSMSETPICRISPPIEKITASRQRGSERNRPFQLVCIAHKEIGR